MNIDELRSAQSKERQKSDLQQLRESFYGDVAAYVEELEDERERAAERAEDPFGSPEVQQLTNDIETAKDTAEAIYERRLGKIVKKASLVSAEMANPNDVSGLTTEEQALFDDLVDRIEANKAHMLDVIAGDADPGAREATGRDSTASTPRSDTADSTMDASASAGTNATGDADETSSVPHPEDGLGAGAGAGADEDAGEGAASDSSSEEAADLRAAEAAAVAGDGVPEDDATGSSGGSEPDASVSAADLMSGDSDADATEGAGRDASGHAGTTGDATDDDAGSDGAAGESTGEDADAPATDTDGGVDERATLRVTRDVGEIFGVDEREYTLSAEDVVTLPEENADVLVQQGAAERLD